MTGPGSPSSPRHAWWRGAYRLTLLAFPAEFRDRWGNDMQLAFADRVQAARRARGTTPWRLVGRELASVLAGGLRERLHHPPHSTTRSFDMLQMLHWQDIRYAFRLLGRSPGFTLLTVLVLAGGLGLSTFTFSFLHTAMIRPLPLGDGDRIVRLSHMDSKPSAVDVVDLAALRASMSSIRDIGAYTAREVILGRDRDAESRVLSATVADPVLFAVGATPPLLGRALLPSDAESGAEPVIVLSYRTWEVAFGSDRSVLNTHVAINGVSTRVVGVMPAGFGFPVIQDAWLPLPVRSAATQPDQQLVSVFGRLTPGASRERAAAEATAIVQRSLAARDTSSQPSRGVIAVESFPAAQMGEGRMILFTGLNLTAALILLLALVNVTTLLTARANERIRETAVRLALGASTGRLIMQGMWEGIILCVTGGIIGTAATAWGLEAITRWTQINMEGNMAFWWVWQMDGVTLLTAGAFVTVAIAALGSIVVRRAIRTNVREVMQDGSARSGARREGRLARTLVATQVATVTVLMFVGVLSGVMARRVVNMDPGYDPARLLQASLEPPTDRFSTDAARALVFSGVATRLSEHGAVESVLLRRRLAAKEDDGGRFARRERSTTSLPTANIIATFGATSTLGIKIIEGRPFEASDDAVRAPVAAISRSLAMRDWRGRSPIGDQIRLAAVGDTLQWRTIVGVVSDLPYGNPFSRDRGTDAIYVPLLQAGVSYVDVMVRYRTSEVAGRQALQQVFGAVDPLLVPESVFRASEVIQKSGLITTGLTKLFGSCFAFALLLAVAGSYGLMSRSIGLRTREIGVRRALGATDAVATRMLLAQGTRQLGVGALVAAPILTVVGVASSRSFPLGGVLTATVGVLVSLAIVAVVLVATWVPTRKVLRVPMRDALWRD